MLSQEKSTRESIEETGKVFEKFGLTPMQGRIVAYFTVSDPPEKTFDELVKYFKASKSSVSNSLNYLLQSKIIDYKTFASDRKRYFYITDSFFRVYFVKVLENVTELKEYAYRTVSMRTPEYPVASEKILKWIENANRFQETLENTLDSIQDEKIRNSL
ncbi:MAG: helix-turn-helix domain-containing protein [Bacteroidia bacterium]|nr:helix-turn-helix domain-containing protein [Bacteroidia bacterium]